MSNEPKGEWAEAMIAVGAVDPRRDVPVPSWNRLAEMAGVSTTTLTAMVAGSTQASPTTVSKVAKALRVKPEVVSGWIQTARVVRDAYRPPPEADLMDDRQRRAVTELIRSFVKDTGAAAGGNVVPLRPGSAPHRPEAPLVPEDLAAHDPGEPSQGERARQTQNDAYNVDQDAAGEKDPGARNEGTES